MLVSSARRLGARYAARRAVATSEWLKGLTDNSQRDVLLLEKVPNSCTHSLAGVSRPCYWSTDIQARQFSDGPTIVIVRDEEDEAENATDATEEIQNASLLPDHDDPEDDKLEENQEVQGESLLSFETPDDIIDKADVIEDEDRLASQATEDFPTEEEASIENQDKDGDKTFELIERAVSLTNRTDNPFECEESYQEAIDVIEQLFAVGFPGFLQAAHDLLSRLATAVVCRKMDSDSTNAFVKSWFTKRARGIVPSKRISLFLDLVANKALVPDDTTLEFLLDPATRTLFDEDNDVRTIWEMLKKHSPNDESLRQAIDECAENVLIQVQARQGNLVEAMQMAKDLIEREGMQDDATSHKIRDSTFMSILVAAVTCATDERPQVMEFLAWAGEQYASGDSRIDVKVESIYLFGWAVQTRLAHGEEIPAWLLDGIGWIGKEVSGECGGTEDYEKAIKLWAHAGQLGTARAILDLMFKKWQEGRSSIVPNIWCYSTLLSPLAKPSSKGKDYGDVPIGLHAQMTELRPTGFMTHCWAVELALVALGRTQHPQAPTEAARICQAMLEEWFGRAPIQVFTTAIEMLGAKNWREQAELLDWLEKEYNERNIEGHLSRSFFDCLLYAKMQSGHPNIGSVAVSILERAHRMGLLDSGSTQLFMRATKAISQSEDPHFGPEFDRILSLHQETHQKSPWILAEKTRFRAMEYYAGLGHAEKTESLLKTKYDCYLSSQSGSPSTRDFNMVLLAWSNSGAPRAAERCDAIVENMRLLHGVKLKSCKPDKSTVELLIRCWNKSSLPEAAQRVRYIKDNLL